MKKNSSHGNHCPAWKIWIKSYCARTTSCAIQYHGETKENEESCHTLNICEACGGTVKVVACVDDPAVINKILTHLQISQSEVMLPVSRAPPVTLLLN